MFFFFFVWSLLKVAADPEDTTYRLRVGADAAENIEVLSQQREVFPEPGSSFVVPGLTSNDLDESSRFWYGNVHGVPMLFAELPASLAAQAPDFIEWLLAKEVEWSQLPTNDGWPVAEAAQVTSKYRWYNVLAAMAEDPTMKETQVALKRFIIDHFLILQGRFQEAIEMSLDNITREFWQSKYSRLGVGLPTTTDFSLAPSLYIESWLNSHRPLKGMNALSVHEHGYPWHGYILLKASPSNTSYYSPTSKSFFSLQNSDNILVMLPGGIDHAVLATVLPNRISIAFDITYGINFHGRVVTHPSVIYPPPVLDDKTANTWIQLMDEQEMSGKDFYTFDYKSVRQECGQCPGLKSKNWAGLVDIRALLDSVTKQRKHEL